MNHGRQGKNGAATPRIKIHPLWWKVMASTEPCEWGSRLRDERNQNLNVKKETSISIINKNFILNWLEDDQFPIIVISSWIDKSYWLKK